MAQHTKKGLDNAQEEEERCNWQQRSSGYESRNECIFMSEIGLIKPILLGSQITTMFH